MVSSVVALAHRPRLFPCAIHHSGGSTGDLPAALGDRSPGGLEMFEFCSQHHRGDAAAAEQFRSTVMTALRPLPSGVLRDLAKRWPLDGNRAERVVAAAICEALLRSDSQFDRRPQLQTLRPY